ncbi:MAG TPA: ABC transporter substrate-binding protein [Chloroflexota bacterium]|nr:ABC transporter substrate-binding protein [Chloroflexota bacterium]
MPTLRLSVGCGDYDRTRALFDGSVPTDGFEIAWEPVNVPHELFVRVLHGEFDVAEMSFSSLTNAIGRGSRDLIGIPVFTSRLFRHSFIYVNTDSGIEAPQDLIGKRVGVPDYTITAAVWIRGLLQHDYGVAPEQIHWLIGGLDTPAKILPLAPRLPSNVKIEQTPDGSILGDMLERGALDAVVCASIPRVFLQGASRVRRLFPDYHRVEADYYRRTGIVPIMHVVALRRSIYEEHRWIAASLYRAFSQSKARCYEWLRQTGAPRTTLTWLQAYLDEEREIFGNDPWPYGVAANRSSIEALTLYVYEQGLCERRVATDELFAPETLDLT